jgi:hypothetical protein
VWTRHRQTARPAPALIPEVLEASDTLDLDRLRDVLETGLAHRHRGLLAAHLGQRDFPLELLADQQPPHEVTDLVEHHALRGCRQRRAKLRQQTCGRSHVHHRGEQLGLRWLPLFDQEYFM